MTSIIFGLLAALAWGGSDFCGAVSSRKTGAYRTIFFSEIAGLVVLLAALPLAREALPDWPSLLIAFAGGGIGALGLLLLFQAMMKGPLSTAAPLSALLAAAVPILVGSVSEGLPGFVRLGGFGLALAAIWLFAWEEGGQAHALRPQKLFLPLLSGLGFGLYFVLLHQAGQHSTLWTLISARCGGILVLLAAICIRREALKVARGAPLFIGLSALLDVGANLCYLLAGQSGRMDVAAVLSALYPGGTILLARVFLKERLQPRQAAGILAALAAIVLMTV